jgi:hypothetical protein
MLLTLSMKIYAQVYPISKCDTNEGIGPYDVETPLILLMEAFIICNRTDFLC